mgnify:CR=1 FL=1|tara:strand:- start:230 stop:373 length:144 start_codon:yes stop_codon:yes gene_type:complete
MEVLWRTLRRAILRGQETVLGEQDKPTQDEQIEEVLTSDRGKFPTKL